MAQKIILKRSAVPNKVPTTIDLDLGEMGLNTYDGEMYFKKNNGAESIVKIATTNNLKTINSTNLIGTGNINVSLPTKSGVKINTDFTGNPKKTIVTFSTAFSDNNYSISITGEDARTWSIESKTASGFTINANANTGLTGNVYYIAVKHGEV